jgi:glutathione synthase
MLAQTHPEKTVKKLLWITDPWNTLAHSNDTTLRLMDEAIKLGVPTYWSATDFIFSIDSNSVNSSTPVVKSTAQNQLIRVIPCVGDHWHETTPIEMDLREFHQIHYRVDPPVDFNYISVIDKLTQAGGGSQILNPLALLKFQSEKIPPKSLQNLIPKFISITNEASAREAASLFEAEQEIVLKPLNTAQSIGVKKITRNPNQKNAKQAWLEIFRSETLDFSEPRVIQEYLPQINDGEIRVWYINGEILGTLKKFPKAGDFRVLIDEGSQVKKYTLNAEEKIRAEQVGAVLKQQNAAMAAIDFIGNKISDYNITSPGLLVQMEALYDGHNFARTIIEGLIARD